MFVQVGEVWHDWVYFALARKQKQMVLIRSQMGLLPNMILVYCMFLCSALSQNNKSNADHSMSVLKPAKKKCAIFMQFSFSGCKNRTCTSWLPFFPKMQKWCQFCSYISIAQKLTSLPHNYTTSNGNRTELSSIWPVIKQVISKIGQPHSGSPICLSRVWLRTKLDSTQSYCQLII